MVITLLLLAYQNSISNTLSILLLLNFSRKQNYINYDISVLSKLLCISCAVFMFILSMKLDITI